MDSVTRRLWCFCEGSQYLLVTMGRRSVKQTYRERWTLPAGVENVREALQDGIGLVIGVVALGSLLLLFEKRHPGFCVECRSNGIAARA